MNISQQASLVLRITIFGEFIGHGIFALGLKKEWVGWLVQLFGVTPDLAGTIVFVIGLFDIAVGISILIKPMKWVLVWATFWGFATALIRPIVGMPVWDFVERWANWGAPLALYILEGFGNTILKSTNTIDKTRK